MEEDEWDVGRGGLSIGAHKNGGKNSHYFAALQAYRNKAKQLVLMVNKGRVQGPLW